jgi:hypothetical protein
MGYYDTYEFKYMFYAIFQILFHVHIVQFGIVFYMNAEIHLICRK